MKELAIMETFKEYNFRSVVITQLHMGRYFFVTKETMEGYYKQQIDIDLRKIDVLFLNGNRMDFLDLVNHRSKHEESFLKESTGDDLELFFENLQMGGIKENSVSFFLPKAKPGERKVVEERNANYLFHYCSSWNNYNNLYFYNAERKDKIFLARLTIGIKLQIYVLL